MDALLRQQRVSMMGSVTPGSRRSQQGKEASFEEDKEGPNQTPESKAQKSTQDKEETTPGSASGKNRSSFLSRLSTGFFKNSNLSNDDDGSAGEGLAALLKDAESNEARYDEAWYQRWSLRLSKDGLACTKVATNGRPYERRLHIDSRNLTVEIRGGRGGATGVLLDDLVDIRQGLHIDSRNLTVEIRGGRGG